jgi:hypothetical protein
VLDDGDVVDRCRRELSASVTRRALDSAGGKKIGKGGRSNGGGGSIGLKAEATAARLRWSRVGSDARRSEGQEREREVTGGTRWQVGQLVVEGER